MEPEFEDIEARLISGKGILQIPQDDDWSEFRIYTNLVRDPTPDYRNNKWNPPLGEYAKVVYVADDYVISNRVIQFEREVFSIYAKQPAAFLVPPLVCAFQSLLNGQSAIISLLTGLPPVPGPDIPFPIIGNPVTQIQFFCRDGSAIQVILRGIREDKACPEAEGSPKRDTPPPDPLPKVPPDESIEVSPPYNDPNDDGNTEPFEGDVEDNGGDFPVGSECQPVRIIFEWVTVIDPPGNLVTRDVLGPVEDVFLEVNPDGAQVLARARAGSDSDPCQPEAQEFQLISFGDPAGFVSYELISVEPI